jgi:hypothetical protein
MDSENQYHFIDRVLPALLDRLGLPSDHCGGLSSAHGDKFYSLRMDYERLGYHFNFGAIVGLLSYIQPFCDECRDTNAGWVCPTQWSLANLARFEADILQADTDTRSQASHTPSSLKLTSPTSAYTIAILHATNLRDAEPTSPRSEVFTYHSDKSGDDAADEAFHLFNASISLIPEFQHALVKQYRDKGLRSLSVGDVVRVTQGHNVKEFYCDSFGWEHLT